MKVYSLDGSQLDEFDFVSESGCEFYTLTRTTLTDSGIAAVMGYNPPVEGETFWQHDIDLKNRCVGTKRLAKWR